MSSQHVLSCLPTQSCVLVLNTSTVFSTWFHMLTTRFGKHMRVLQYVFQHTANVFIEGLYHCLTRACVDVNCLCCSSDRQVSLTFWILHVLFISVHYSGCGKLRARHLPKTSVSWSIPGALERQLKTYSFSTLSRQKHGSGHVPHPPYSSGLQSILVGASIPVPSWQYYEYYLQSWTNCFIRGNMFIVWSCTVFS